MNGTVLHSNSKNSKMHSFSVREKEVGDDCSETILDRLEEEADSLSLNGLDRRGLEAGQLKLHGALELVQQLLQ